MSNVFSSNFLTRVLNSWKELRHDSIRLEKHTDRLVKINLPPLMGRRDANYDFITKLLMYDFFAFNAVDRTQMYRLLSGVLTNVCDDTDRLHRIMSSRDTSGREKNLSDYFAVLLNNVSMLVRFVDLEERAFRQHKSTDILQSDDLRDNEQVMTKIEITLVQQLRAIFERSDVKAKRYRSYVLKNLSKENRQRYQSAYDLYTSVCEETYKLPTNVTEVGTNTEQ